MHELSLAGEIIRATSEKLRDMEDVLCPRLRVRVGELSGVSAEGLRFCLEVARAGTPSCSTCPDREPRLQPAGCDRDPPA